MEEGEGGEHEGAGGSGWRRAKVTEVPATTTAITTITTTLTTTADSIGFGGLCTKAKSKIHLSLDLKIHSGAGVE